ncbi:MAG: hypothetical protein ACT4O0_10900 [Pseudonocardia sp.]
MPRRHPDRGGRTASDGRRTRVPPSPFPSPGAGGSGGSARPAVGWARTEVADDGEWLVRSVPGARASKAYRCPGCDHEIRPGVAHVVVWSADGGAAGFATRPVAGAAAGAPVGFAAADADDRRHWHTPCWSARLRRRPGRRV